MRKSQHIAPIFRGLLLATAATVASWVPARAQGLALVRSFGPDIGSVYEFAPYGVAAGGGRVYAADPNNNQVFQFDPASPSPVFMPFGPVSGGAGDAQFHLPIGAAHAEGRIYVADLANDRIVRFDPVNFAESFATFESTGQGVGQFRGPDGVTVSDGLVYVSDTGSGRIVRFDPNDFTHSFTSFGSLGSGSGQFQIPAGLAVSGGFVYVADALNDRVVRFDPNDFTSSFTVFGTLGSGTGQFHNPRGVTVVDGLVYVTDSENDRIVRFNPLSFAQSFTTFGASVFGPVAPSSLYGISSDGQGNLFVSDPGRGLIHQFAIVPEPASLFLTAGGILIGTIGRCATRRSQDTRHQNEKRRRSWPSAFGLYRKIRRSYGTFMQPVEIGCERP